jgi:heme/copper-type cytochrome/quinol oxidase subunit 3
VRGRDATRRGADRVRLPGLFTARPPSRRVQWWVSFVLFTLLASAWALADPLSAGPDEPDHIIRAASVARGELIGQTRPEQPDHVRFVKVPSRLARSRLAHGCFAFRPRVTAECGPTLDSGPDGVERVSIGNGRYPPTPFGVLGLPSLIQRSSAGVYLMRIWGAALCGALLASALLTLREARVRWLAASGLAFALTPMVFFVASIVNPSNLEIAGGVGLWASGVVLVSKARDGVVDGRVVARTAIAAGVLVLARPLGMVWLGTAGVVFLLLCTWPGLRLLLRSRVAQVWGGVVALCIAFELGWISFYDALGSKSPLGESADGLSNFEVLKRTFGYTNASYREMIGRFGWLDTPAPSLTVVLWTAALGVLVALGIGLAPRRQALAIAALLGLIIAVPAVLEFIEARRFGFGWQGRYTLPLAVGLPILSGFALAQEPRRNLPRGRLTIVLGIAFVVAHFIAFSENLRRYMVGINGSLTFWLDADWSPPLPSSLLLVAYAVLLVALALWLWGDTASREDATSQVAPETG